MDWIQGEKFKEIVDFIYSPEHKLPDDYDNLSNTFDLALLKDQNVVYTHIGYVKQLFDVIRKINKKFIIVTHSCDCSIEEYGMRRPNGARKIENVYFFTIPDNVVKWYSKNVNMIDPRLEAIPTGIENNRWLVNVHKKEKMIEKSKQQRKIKNLAYLNFATGTNPDERQMLYGLFENESWVTAEYGRYKFDEYLDNIYNHKFVFSPGGNGMDSHRKWECLYIGTIPIDKMSVDNQFYQDLPICFVDDWKDITEDFLVQEYVRIKSNVWNMDKLNFEYWKDKILSN